MAAKKVSEARTKYATKTKRALTSNRATRPDLAKSVEALNRNVLELQSKLDEVNQRLAAFEFRIEHLSAEERGRLMLAEPAFAFWDNEADAIYDAGGDMLTHIRGVIHGKQIELDQETELLAGSRVVIDVKAQSLSLDEKRDWVDRLCGAWADDPSLKTIFAEIEQGRTFAIPRKVDFDAAA